MVIGIILQYGNETIEVRVNCSQILFRTSQFRQFVTIENLKLDKGGVIKEFPDLEGNDEWKDEAIKRFNEKIKNMKNETEIAQYVIDDLTKFGYKPMFMQKDGFRPVKLYK